MWTEGIIRAGRCHDSGWIDSSGAFSGTGLRWLGAETSATTRSMRRDDPWMSPRAAVRRILHGTHSGWGMFGTPTGTEVHVLGISHVECGRWDLRQEYVLFDETAIWKQILLQSG